MIEWSGIARVFLESRDTETKNTHSLIWVAELNLAAGVLQKPAKPWENWVLPHLAIQFITTIKDRMWQIWDILRLDSK